MWKLSLFLDLSVLEPLSVLSQHMYVFPGGLFCALPRSCFLPSGGSGCVVLVWGCKSLFWNPSYFKLCLFRAAWPGVIHIQHTVELCPLLIVSDEVGKNNHLLKLDMLLGRCPLKGRLYPRMPLEHSLKKRPNVWEYQERYSVSPLIRVDK